MTKVSLLVVSLILLSYFFINCGNYSVNDKKTYSFIEWNPYLKDSIKTTFLLDSTFAPSPHGITCFDDGSTCHVFDYNSCKITINYGPFTKGPINSSKHAGEGHINKIMDAYPNAKISQQKIFKSGMLEGVMTESVISDLYRIDYDGCNEEMLMAFNIHLEAKDRQLNYSDIVVSLINSISIEPVAGF